MDKSTLYKSVFDLPKGEWEKYGLDKNVKYTLSKKDIEDTNLDYKKINDLNTKIQNIISNREKILNEKKYQEQLETEEAKILKKELRSKLSADELKEKLAETKMNKKLELEKKESEDEEMDNLQQNIDVLNIKISERNPKLNTNDKINITIAKDMFSKKYDSSHDESIDIKFIKDKKQKDFLIENASAHLTLFMKTAIGFISTILGLVMGLILTVGIFTGPGIPIFALVTVVIGIFIILLVGGIWALGGLIAMSKAMYLYINNIPEEGVAMWLYRICIAFLLSWKYLFMK